VETDLEKAALIEDSRMVNPSRKELSRNEGRVEEKDCESDVENDEMERRRLSERKKSLKKEIPKRRLQKLKRTNFEGDDNECARKRENTFFKRNCKSEEHEDDDEEDDTDKD
jgi:hypothetical protein